MHGEGGHAWQRGACMAKGGGGMHDGSVHGRGVYIVGGHAWQERWPLQQKVRILLECIHLYLFVYLFWSVYWAEWVTDPFAPKFNN